MATLGTLYLKLTNELQLVHNSEVDITCNVLSFGPDLQSLFAGLFPIGTSNHSIELSKLSVLKLFMELILAVPKCAPLRRTFNNVFAPGFLDSLIAQDRLSSRLTVSYLISELTALFLFTTQELGVTEHLNHQSIAEYLDCKCLSTKMKLRVVNSLCKLQKQYQNESFAGIFSDVFGTLIWNRVIVSSIENDVMFYVKLCSDVLSTNAVTEIRPIMFQEFEFILDFFCVVDDINLKSCVCTFLNELFPYHGYDYGESGVVTSTAAQIFTSLRKTDCALLHGVDIPAACIAVLRISLWILGERNSISCGKDTIEDVSTVFKCFEMTGEKLIYLCIEEDKELIDLLMLHLDLSWIVYKKGISDDICCSFVRIKPWDLFLELMLNLSFDETLLNDWLISNETHFLRYFIKLCKMLRLFWSEFSHTCAEMSAIQRIQDTLSSLGTATLFDACMSAVIRLKLKIVRLHGASLYPYSPEPLIKLLTSLEDLYECEDVHT